jgi:hypothetical protein
VRDLCHSALALFAASFAACSSANCTKEGGNKEEEQGLFFSSSFTGRVGGSAAAWRARMVQWEVNTIGTARGPLRLSNNVGSCLSSAPCLHARSLARTASSYSAFLTLSVRLLAADREA